MSEETARHVVMEVLSTVLRDEPWQDLGFECRPVYGTLNQRFRPTWKIQLEKALLKEMLGMFIAVYVAATVIHVDNIAWVIKLCAGGQDLPRDTWRTLGYASRAEAEEHLRAAILAYTNHPSTAWPSLMASRVGVAELPDHTLAATLLVGTVTFARTAEDMLHVLRSRIRHRNLI